MQKPIAEQCFCNVPIPIQYAKISVESEPEWSRSGTQKLIISGKNIFFSPAAIASAAIKLPVPTDTGIL